MNAEKAVLLVGSAKAVGQSASEALGSYLLEQLAARGMAVETFRVQRVLRTEARTRQFLQSVDDSDIFVLAFPLYVDTLPHLVTRALERIAAHRQALQPATQPRFLAIANCGFPEASHNDVALAICRQFAQQAHLRWVGGLARGAGQPLGGQKLAEAGGMARDAIAALDLAAEDLAQGQPVSAAAIAYMAQPMLPPRLYTLMGEMGWRWQAWQHGVYRQLAAKPFTQN